MPKAGELLSRLGIDISDPRLVDSKEFVRAERTTPNLLDAHADFVQGRSYDEEYVRHARQVVSAAAAFMYEELEADGRLSACVDASVVLSRFLRDLGIWNYAVKGSLRVDFPDGREEPTYFAAVVPPHNPALAGHVWIYAPPFQVVDVTATLQPYQRGELASVDGPVLAEEVVEGHYNLADLFDMELLEAPSFYGVPPTVEVFRRQQPELFSRILKYGVHEVSAGGWSLTYVACGITAGEPVPLAEMKNLILSERNPADLFRSLQERLR